MSMSINVNGILKNKVAIITGASRGLGVAVAKRFAMEGAKVVVTARSVAAGDHYLGGTINETVEEINQAGGEALAVQADLNLAEDRARLVTETKDAFGAADILVNNAAITYFMPVSDFTEKRFRLMMDVQVWAPFELSQLVLPDMRERGEGWILNVSSHAAIHPEKTSGGRGGTVYGMCKAALERFTTGLAAELYEENIGVNVISPGLVETPGTVHHNLITEESKDRVTPIEHMAEACLHLCHGDPKVLTGRIDYADDVMKEFDLKAADLV
ncbi:MAG: citronellol/citronellal dehydrogenase [Limisphaerales bacterium]|jgi:citronellol/citronellal dehydrogenase